MSFANEVHYPFPISTIYELPNHPMHNWIWILTNSFGFIIPCPQGRQFLSYGYFPGDPVRRNFKNRTMATQDLKNERSGAEVYYGAEMCYKKSLELLEAMDLPKGLLPLKNLEESGYAKETGFVWLKQKQPFEHYNKKTGKTVLYGTELTSYVGKRTMKKMTGVKSKELLFWIHITEMAINDPSSKKVYFKSSLGIGKSFPIDAFQLEDEN